MRRDLKIPRKLVEEEPYRNMSHEARIIYSIMLDLKETVAGEKNWIDSHGFRYLLYPKKYIQSLFDCSRYKADKYLHELEIMGLVRFEYARTPLLEKRTYVRTFEPAPDDVYMGDAYDAGDIRERKAVTHNPDRQECSSGKEYAGKDAHKDAGKEKADREDKHLKKREDPQKSDPDENSPLHELFFARLCLKNICIMTTKLEKKLEEIYESME